MSDGEFGPGYEVSVPVIGDPLITFQSAIRTARKLFGGGFIR